MEYPVIVSRINDLPGAFKRPDTIYESWQTAQAAALLVYCAGADSVINCVTFTKAQAGWLDVWGELFGIPRNPTESDQVYTNRISSLLQAPVGSPFAIQQFTTGYFNYPCTVTETPPGYSIQIPYFVTPAQLSLYLVALARIRPAGVPVTILQQSTNGCFLNTFLFTDGNGFAGAYLGGSINNQFWAIGAGTNNSRPLLPALLLTDPILNNQITV